MITLMGEHKPVPQLASARIKRWSLLLAGYNYTIEFIPGKQNVYADFLSRIPIDPDPSHEKQGTVNVMFIEGDQFVNASMVARATNKDAVTQRPDVLKLIGLNYLKWFPQCFKSLLSEFVAAL